MIKRKKFGIKRKPKKRRKKSKLTLAKDRLWELTRQIVFLTYGRDCYTCPQINLIGINCQGGHVPWPSALLSPECRFMIKFVRAQCFNCNMNLGGMGAKALARMTSEIGQEAIDKMWQLSESGKGRPYKLQWYLDKEAAYKIILEQLKV
jgi:hypothetical protein